MKHDSSESVTNIPAMRRRQSFLARRELSSAFNIAAAFLAGPTVILALFAIQVALRR